MQITNPMPCWSLFLMNSEDERAELAARLRRRDPDLLATLIEQYQYRLFRYLLSLTSERHIAEDLFQETWLRVLERGRQYDSRFNFEAWLFGIARHLVIDHFRRRKSEALAELPEISSAGASPLALAMSQEESGRLSGALESLPATMREVLVLRFQEEMKLEEIAHITSAPVSTVKSRLYRALDSLRKLVEGTA